MSCICCFFDNEYQKELKNSSMGKSFQNELLNYQKRFMSCLFSLGPVETCGCSLSLNITNKNMKEFIRDVEAALKEERAKNAVISVFENAIEIYTSFQQGNKSEAIDKAGAMASLLSVENNHFVSRPLFRARTKGSYDKKEIREYFHVPFEKKSIVPRQRFSAAEQPMLYLAGSVRTALAELSKTIDEVEIAAFMPSFSWFHISAGCNFITLGNEFDSSFNEVIPILFDAGSKINFTMSHFSMSYNGLPQVLKKTISYQILTYPNKNADESFVSAYVLPQIFTQACSNDSNSGIIYLSTKSDIWTNTKPSSPLNKNICFYVPNTSTNGYDENLLSKFSYATYDATTAVSVENVEMLLADMFEWCKTKIAQGFNLTDWVLYFHNAQVHIQEVKSHSSEYYCSNEGLIELNLIHGLYQSLYSEAKKFVNDLGM